MTRAAVVALAFAALLAGSAGAKEDVEATLLTPLAKDAAPGTTIHVAWRLADLGGRPFGAGGIFVRLVGAGGAATTADARETATGRYAADVAVPDGGTRAIRIGLRGTSCAQTCRDAPMWFRIVNDPFADTWTPLRRRLVFPTLGANRSCPVSHPPRRVRFASFGVGVGLGPGPAYPVGWRTATIPIRWATGDVDARVWGVQKVLWFVHPSYRGPVLVRGVQLDGSSRVRFERGRIPPAELHLPAGTKARPSYVRIRQPGCYAFQIDGLTFSRSIVFRAVRG